MRRNRDVYWLLLFLLLAALLFGPCTRRRAATTPTPTPSAASTQTPTPMAQVEIVQATPTPAESSPIATPTPTPTATPAAAPSPARSTAPSPRAATPTPRPAATPSATVAATPAPTATPSDEEPPADEPTTVDRPKGPVTAQFNFYIRGDEINDPAYKFVAQRYRDTVLFDAELRYGKETFTERGDMTVEAYAALVEGMKKAGLSAVADDAVSDSHFSYLLRSDEERHRGVLYARKSPDGAVIDYLKASIVGATCTELARRAGAPTLDLWSR